jgi:hypothetical protein
MIMTISSGIVVPSNVVALTPPAVPSDVEIDIRNTFDALDRMPAVLAWLRAQRNDAAIAFAKKIAPELAAGDPLAPDKIVVASSPKVKDWVAADAEIDTRIKAFTQVADELRRRICGFEDNQPDAVIAFLERRIQALNDQLQQDQTLEQVLRDRIDALTRMKTQLEARPTQTAKAVAAKVKGTAKKTAKKTPRKTAAKKTAKKI